MHRLYVQFSCHCHPKEVYTGILFLFLLFNAQAQYDLRLQTFLTDDGLSQSAVHCMYQDKYGFLWLGTFDGLNRYDGYEFKVTREGSASNKLLSGKFIRAIAADKKDILWIGSSKGLNRLNTLTGKVEHFINDPQDENSLIDNDVLYVIVDSKGLVWAGTAKGVSTFDYANKRFKHYIHVPNSDVSLTNGYVTCIYEDMNNHIWISTSEGLNCFSQTKEEFKRYVNIPGDANSLSSNDINFITEYNKGKFLVGTKNAGLNEFDIVTQKCKRYRNDPADPNSINGDNVSSVVEFKPGIFWIITNGGLSSFNSATFSFTSLLPLPHKSKRFLADTYGKLLKDREGNVWISWENVLQKYNPRLQYFAHFKNDPTNSNSLNNNRIWSMKEDKDGFLWIGTIGGGLNRFDRHNNKWKHYLHDPSDSYSLSSDDIWDICQSRDGMLWVTTTKGLDCLDRKTSRFTHYQHDKNDSNSVSDGFFLSNVIEDRAGDIWVGTRNGLNRFDRKTKKFHHYYHDPADSGSINTNKIRTLLEDRNGNIWVCTSFDGVNCLNITTNKFKRYSNRKGDANSINNMKTQCIMEDRNGKIWIGGENGIDCIDPATGGITHYLEKDGLPNESVLRIEEDKNGRLWISSNMGIARLDPQKKQFKSFDVPDGLQSRQFSSFCGGQSKITGEFFFGGINGFNIFHPDSIRDNGYKPVVVINTIRRFNNEVNSAIQHEENIINRKSITLSSKDNSFSLNFLSVSLDKPARNQYAYQLKGFSNQWIELGTKRDVTFTGLPPGRYTLLVKGSNGDGVWNNVPTELMILLLPPWYRTWLFYLLCAFILGTLLYIFSRYRLQQKLRVLQIRNRLHRDLHDDVGATLSSVKAYSEMLQTDSGNKIISNLIKENATEMLDRLEVISWATNPHHDNFKSLTDLMHKFANPILHAKNVQFSLEKDGIQDQFVIDGEIRQNIYLVFKEAISNIIKHAEASECRVLLLIKNSRFILHISDNGTGYNTKMHSNRFGLKNMRKRADELGGQLEVSSDQGTGTTLKLSIPFPFKLNMAIREKGIF